MKYPTRLREISKLYLDSRLENINNGKLTEIKMYNVTHNSYEPFFRMQFKAPETKFKKENN